MSLDLLSDPEVPCCMPCDIIMWQYTKYKYRQLPCHGLSKATSQKHNNNNNNNNNSSCFGKKSFPIASLEKVATLWPPYCMGWACWYPAVTVSAGQELETGINIKYRYLGISGHALAVSRPHYQPTLPRPPSHAAPHHPHQPRQLVCCCCRANLGSYLNIGFWNQNLRQNQGSCDKRGDKNKNFGK